MTILDKCYEVIKQTEDMKRPKKYWQTTQTQFVDESIDYYQKKIKAYRLIGDQEGEREARRILAVYQNRYKSNL